MYGIADDQSAALRICKDTSQADGDALDHSRGAAFFPQLFLEVPYGRNCDLVELGRADEWLDVQLDMLPVLIEGAAFKTGIAVRLQPELPSFLK